MRAFILAGGFATRLWPLTEQRSKPLLPLAGRPLLTHLIERLPEHLPIVVSTNDAFRESFSRWSEITPRPVTLVVEDVQHEDRKLGALGAVSQWTEQQSDDDILLLTGDNYCGFSFPAFLSAYHPGTPLIAAYDVRESERAKQFGTIITDPATGRITGFEEKPPSPKSTLVSTGCSILPAKVLPVLREFSRTSPDNIGAVFEEFLRRGIPIEHFTFTEPWFDIGSFEAYLDATRALAGTHPILGEGAILERTRTEGSVVLGKGSRATDAHLRDVIAFEDCVIEDCVLTDCILDDGCRLRGVDLTGKMLRRGTVLTRK